VSYAISLQTLLSHLFLGKAYLQQNGLAIHEAEDPILALLESTAYITGEMA
jgi:hypothetical protein